MRRTPHARTLAAALSCAALLLTTGCNDSDGTEPTNPTAETTSATPTPTETEPTEPAWMDKYTDKEIRIYETALARWEEYEQRSAPFWAKGQANDTAKQVFSEYWVGPMDSNTFDLLQIYADSNVQFKGLPTVLWSKPARIIAKARFVVIRQCLDSSTVQVLQNGEPGKQETNQSPGIREITISQSKGNPYLIESVTGEARESALNSKVKTCTG